MGIFDYLSNLEFKPSPNGMGLINMGASMLANSGPSRLPQSGLQNLGVGLQGYNEGYGQQQALEAAHAAAQQKALLDASTIRENDAKAGYYQNGGSGSDGYHQPVQTSQGWAQWDAATKKYKLIQLDGGVALPVAADVPLAGQIAGAKADNGITQQTMSDGRVLPVRNGSVVPQLNQQPQQNSQAAVEQNIKILLDTGAINQDQAIAMLNAHVKALQNESQPQQYNYKQSPVVAGQIGQKTADKEWAQVPAHVDEARQVTAAKIKAEAEAKAQNDFPGQVASAEQMSNLTNELINHKGLPGVVGMPNLWGAIPFPGTEEANFKNRLEQIKGKVFLQAFDTLKGGGQITEIEGKKATSAMARLENSQTEDEFKKSLKELNDVTSSVTERLKNKAYGGNEIKPSAPIVSHDESGANDPAYQAYLRSHGK